MSGQTKASASVTVQFIKGMGTVRRYLECSTGDFYQRYTGAASSPTQCMPDYTGTPATLTLRIYDSATGQPVAASGIGTADWWFGTTQITFNAQGQSTNAPFAGLLERGTDDTGMPQLTVKGNLVAALNGLSASVKCVTGYTADDGTTSKLVDVIPFSCMQANENDYACHITGNPDMAIREHGGSVTLSVLAYRGIALATPAAWKWEKYDTSPATPAWTSIGTGATVAIAEADVDSSLTVRCTVTFDSGATAIDTATVNDVSDPVQLLPCPTPEDSVVYDPSAPGYIRNVNDKVTYSPVLSATDDRADAISGHSGLFNFRVLGPAGEEIQGASATGVATYTLKGETLRALGYPSVLVVIDTKI